MKDYPNKINYKNWFTDDDFIENYPTVIYWCFRFNNYFKQFPNFNGNETEIPFWFFIFRFLSSTKCVIIEDKNSFSEFINNKISKLIADKLSAKKYQKLGTSWLNLLLNNLPNDIKNNTLSLIYNFICNLGKDKKYLESPLKDIKIRIIEKILDMIYQKLFENDLINSFNVNDEINLFLSNPNIFIYNEILKELNDKFNKIQTILQF